MGASPGWWFPVDVDGERVFACAPTKCGLISLMTSLVPGLWRVLKTTGVTAGEVALGYARSAGLGPYSGIELVTQFPTDRRVMACREPVERFVSLWRDKCRPELADDPLFRLTAGLSPVQLLCLVQAFPFGNSHWMPQHAFLLPGTEVVRFERLLPYLGRPAIHVHKATVPAPEIGDLLWHRVRCHYDWDGAMWDRVVAAGDEPWVFPRGPSP